MRRLFLFLILLMAVAPYGLAGEDAPAVINLKDGRSFRVFLMSNAVSTVETEFQKLRTPKSFEPAEILDIKFTPVGFDDNELDAFVTTQSNLFEQADYEALIAQSQPALAPYGDYMNISNNLQYTYGFLMQTYSRSGQHSQAAAIAEKLVKTPVESLALEAVVCDALAAADRKDFDTAQNLFKQIENPAAALYVKAAIERAQGTPVKAIQTAVKVIANHGDKLEWLAPVEFLCAELYMDSGRTNSALSTARQTAKLYEGTYIGNEADALHSRIEQLMQTSE